MVQACILSIGTVHILLRADRNMAWPDLGDLVYTSSGVALHVSKLVMHRRDILGGDRKPQVSCQLSQLRHAVSNHILVSNIKRSMLTPLHMVIHILFGQRVGPANTPVRGGYASEISVSDDDVLCKARHQVAVERFPLVRLNEHVRAGVQALYQLILRECVDPIGVTGNSHLAMQKAHGIVEPGGARTLWTSDNDDVRPQRPIPALVPSPLYAVEVPKLALPVARSSSDAVCERSHPAAAIGKCNDCK
mmetsp:Transcript_33619/g.73575  ORF Transcript_33619/g.73575 Transcript_33619/m.73575 type:complete len:248 (+) Transcript_33619:549-1292(+)